MTVKEFKDWFTADKHLSALLKEPECKKLLQRGDSSSLNQEDYSVVISLFDRSLEAIEKEQRELDYLQHKIIEAGSF